MKLSFVFTPHLTPMVRGIFATLYITSMEFVYRFARSCISNAMQAMKLLCKCLDDGVLPQTKHVRASNQCMLSVSKPYEGNTTSSVISNR